MAVDASLIKADANRQTATFKDDQDAARIDPADAPHAVRAYLDRLDEAAFGAASVVQPRFRSHSDPASRCRLSKDVINSRCIMGAALRTAQVREAAGAGPSLSGSIGTVAEFGPLPGRAERSNVTRGPRAFPSGLNGYLDQAACMTRRGRGK